ncbi:MAG: sulfur carrier protein ThiS [Leptospiraceae bacterium]|nr:sulfur carrier protein ThiS [Leptospiraceae bacterium]MDW7976952.1 sulfur carrier protein ThiS [Leptospiraceae bacterium]
MLVNGKEISIQELSEPKIEELIKKFQLQKHTLAIEINGKVIPRSEWEHVVLKDEDKIELIRFVGGG